MTIKPIGVIRLHDKMNLNEIKQVENKILALKGNEKIRSRITNLGKNKVTIFEVYKNTFSERSLHKLEKLKNIFINKKLSENSCLTKGILDRNSVSIKDLKNFLNEKREEIKNSIDNELKDLEDDLKMKINQDYKSISEMSAQNKKIKSEEPEGITQDYDLKKLEDEFGLKDITIEDLRNDEEIKDIKHQKNPNEISIEILDDQPILMDKEDEDEYKFISHPAVEITTSDIVPPPPTDDIGPPPPTDDPGPPPTKVDPDLVERRKLLNLLKDMGLR